MTKIIKLTSENVKRLSAVEITPEGHMVVIGGRNAQGKTSVLDSILYALGGKSAIQAKPLREGAEKGKVVVELENLIVTRTFTSSGGGTLRVENKDGAQFKSPQSILDNLTGQLSFDPLAFSRMEPRKQLETLRELVGIDFSEEDKRRKELFEERTVVNREGKSLAAQYDASQYHENAPEEEIKLSSLLSEQEALEEKQRSHEEAVRTLSSIADMKKHCEREITEIEARLASKKKELEELNKSVSEASEALEKTPSVESQIAEVKQSIATADEANRKVRDNKKKEELSAQLEEKRAESKKLGESIVAIDEAKQAKIAAADFPIEGLSIGEDGVLYNGIPLSQASAAEQLRVSIAIGISANPKLRVMLIKDGSLLDSESLAIVADMAQRSDTQVWMERVGSGSECSVIIEDGHIKD